VRGGDVSGASRCRIKKVDELFSPSGAIGRAPASSGAAFSTVLTREQIDALPDDPDELEAALKAMAPPGSTIRVDGFTGGRLPSKSQIRSIRLPRMDMFAAQNHGGFMGAMFIDILTQPGLGPLRGSVDINFLDEALNARNAFTPTRRPEQLRRAGFNLSGTIRPNKTSFSINANGGTQYTSPNLLAVTPDGSTLTDSVRQPRDSFTVNARLDHAINKDHAIRASVDVDTATSRNLGVGGYNLFDLAYENDTTTSTFRLSENGPLGRRFFTESRFQVRRSDSTDQSAIEAPTIRVIDAFTSGGAQQRGGAASTTFELASDLDYVRGAHSWRTGLLVEGGRHSSDDLTNYLGTYTFASLADFNAGRALAIRAASAIRDRLRRGGPASTSRTTGAHAEPAPGDGRALRRAGARRRRLEPLAARHGRLVAVPAREADGARQLRVLLRLDCRRPLQAEPARRRRPPAEPQHHRPGLSRPRHPR
jgi:hypothetical protein